MQVLAVRSPSIINNLTTAVSPALPIGLAYIVAAIKDIVDVEVIDPVSGTSEVTNVSFYTFTALDEAGEILEITQVPLNTYEEGLKYLDGSKRFRLGEKSREYSNGRKN